MAEPLGAMANPAVERPTEESLLADHLRRLGENRGSVYGVHVHLSLLRPSNRQPNFIRIAARAFESLASQNDATLFKLSNDDLVVNCRDVPVDEVDGAIYKVRALFYEDPLTWGADGGLNDRFTTWYDLAKAADYSAFLAVAGNLATEAAERRQRAAAQATAAMPGPPLEPSNVSEIKRRLQDTRIADMIDQQLAITVGPAGAGEALFRETFVSMAELQKRIAPNVNLFGSTWLFQYLTEALDKRMLAVVARLGLATDKEPISLNLNISTVMSREFQQFHRTVGVDASGMVIEIQLIDVLADVGAFRTARDALQEQGYSVLIDGLGPLTLQYIDVGRFGADYVKIGWNREFVSKFAQDRIQEMRDLVEQAGSERVILARAESEEALKWALGLGIRRFQGRYIDRLASSMSAGGKV